MFFTYLSLSQSLSLAFFNFSETTQQNVLKLWSYEGHSV